MRYVCLIFFSFFCVQSIRSRKRGRGLRVVRWQQFFLWWWRITYVIFQLEFGVVCKKQRSFEQHLLLYRFSVKLIFFGIFFEVVTNWVRVFNRFSRLYSIYYVDCHNADEKKKLHIFNINFINLNTIFGHCREIPINSFPSKFYNRPLNEHFLTEFNRLLIDLFYIFFFYFF